MADIAQILSSGQALYKKALTLIPGGTQLLSKRPEMLLPEYWPVYYKSAKGVNVVDLDGHTYQDMGYHGIGACVLGYGDEDVDGAVIRAVKQGSASVLNCAEEVELAELLVDLHPWADMVRFSRSGGESLSIAVRIARASTGRDVVLFCGYHGWHDWYLAANLTEENDDRLNGHLLPGLQPRGVARSLLGTAFPFHYNEIDELEQLLDKHKGNIAAIVMEPVRSNEPRDGFLGKVRALADEHSAALIFDEVTSGFRLCPVGAHLHYGINPDIAVYAKSISNGYPMGAVVGSRDVMEAAQDTFISSTAWTERTGPAASLAAVRKYIDLSVHTHQHAIGLQVRQGWQAAADAAGLNITISGILPLTSMAFVGNAHGEPAIQKTFFTQEMLKRGYLATTSVYVTLAHSQQNVAAYLNHVGEVFQEMAAAMAAGPLIQRLDGPPVHTGFYRLS